MDSNLDRLACIVTPTVRTTRAFSATLPIPIMDELDRIADDLQIPRSTVLQGLLRDAFIARDTRVFQSIINAHTYTEAQGIDPSSISLEGLGDAFDPEKYGNDTHSMTLAEGYDHAMAEIAAAERMWSI